MDQDPFKKKQEELEITVRIASKEDSQACKDIRIKSLESEDGEKLGVTDEMIKKEKP